MENTYNKSKSRILLTGILIILCTVIAVVLAQGANRDETKPQTKSWQHLALTNVIGQTPKSELARNINKLGREGWEMVSVGNIVESGTTTKTIFYFKKPL
jgi:hypothetical protein